MLITLRHRPDSPSTETPAAPTPDRTTPASQDSLGKLSLTDTRGIEVQEITPVEFIREWARAITRAALAHSRPAREDEANPPSQGKAPIPRS